MNCESYVFVWKKVIIWNKHFTYIIKMASIFSINILSCLSLPQDSHWGAGWIYLTHWGQVTHIYICQKPNPSLIQIMACCLFVAKPLSEPRLDYCLLVYWTLGHIIQWNFNKNSYNFIRKNASENVVRKMASILSQPQCVKILNHQHCFWEYSSILKHC